MQPRRSAMIVFINSRRAASCRTRLRTALRRSACAGSSAAWIPAARRIATPSPPPRSKAAQYNKINAPLGGRVAGETRPSRRAAAKTIWLRFALGAGLTLFGVALVETALLFGLHPLSPIGIPGMAMLIASALGGVPALVGGVLMLEVYYLVN